MSASQSTNTSPPLEIENLEIEDKPIDLVKLANNTRSKSTSTKANPRGNPVILKAPKTPAMPLVIPHGFTTPEEDAAWEHELDFGFGSIWSAYECMYVQRANAK